MNAQFDADEQDKNCTQRRQNNARRVKASTCWRRENVSYGPAQDTANDAEHDGPEKGHVHVHY